MSTEKSGHNPKVCAHSHCSSAVPTGAKELLAISTQLSGGRGAAGQMELCPGYEPGEAYLPHILLGLLGASQFWERSEPSRMGTSAAPMVKKLKMD